MWAYGDYGSNPYGTTLMEVPLAIEIAAYLIVAGLLILLVRSIIKKRKHRTFLMEGKVTQMNAREDRRGKMAYEISLTWNNGEVQRYLTDKEIFSSLTLGESVRVTIRNERVIRAEKL